MKIYLIFLLFSLIFSQNSYINEEYYSYLKSHASFNVCPPKKNKFYNYTDEQIHSLFTIKLKNSNNLSNINKYEKIKYKSSPSNIMEEFDSRTNPEWKDYNCKYDVLDESQGMISLATTCLSWRFCIASQGKINEELSSQYVINCDEYYVWDFFESKGLPTKKCFPNSILLCVEQCEDGSEWKTYKSLTPQNYNLPSAIKEAIQTNGPVQTLMTVYSDFMNYESGIYVHRSGGLLGGMNPLLIGWGIEDGIKFWIAQNSWGKDWGESGYFRIAEGECDIDSSAIAGIPDLESKKYIFE